jgi:hypothetical protein
MDMPGVVEIDKRTGNSGGGSSAVSWGHFGGMLMLIAGTVSFWLLVIRNIKGEKRGRRKRP